MKRIAIVLGVVGLFSFFSEAVAGETLYNGIELPSTWPPQLDKLTLDPMPVPYLDSPPAVIPIDVGRQLFVDKFLIEDTDLQQTFHEAKCHPANPVLEPDKPWERRSDMGASCALGGNVFYDPQDKLFKTWYMGGYYNHTCYATSKDGIHWEKPSLDIVPGTNIIFDKDYKFEWEGQVLPSGVSNYVWLDLEEKDPQNRYKMVRYTPIQRTGALSIFYSGDGIHFRPVGRTGETGDASSIFYNPFRKVWVYNLRDYWEPRIEGKLRKFRRYREGSDLISATANWQKRSDTQLWFCLDRYDLARPVTDPNRELGPYAEIYFMGACGYESVMLGMLTNLMGYEEGRPKLTEVFAGFSRDGWHWYRPYRRPVISCSEDKSAWNWGNLYGGACLVVGDQLYLYFPGRAAPQPGEDTGTPRACTGVAILRRDGFASMRAFDSEGTLTSRPVRFSGRYCFVNADVPKGELSAEILDPDGKVIEPFSRANCISFKGDNTLASIRWKGAEDLSKLAGKPVRFRFYLTAGDLYAFWVSPDASGASHGYVAAGGPGFTGLTDTIGASSDGNGRCGRE